MKNYCLLFGLIVLLTACNKENLVTPLEGTYAGVVEVERKRSPEHPCGINGCEETFQPNLFSVDYEIRFEGAEYVAGINSGTFEWTADSILFKLEQFACPATIDCMVFLPSQQWVAYELADEVLTFAYTSTPSNSSVFVEEYNFSLEKVSE